MAVGRAGGADDDPKTLYGLRPSLQGVQPRACFVCLKPAIQIQNPAVLQNAFWKLLQGAALTSYQQARKKQNNSVVRRERNSTRSTVR